MEQNNSLDPTLLIRYLEAKEQLSSEEQAAVIQWIRRSPENRQEWEQLQKLWEQSGQVGHLSELDTEADWQQVWQKMQSYPDPEAALVKEMPRSRRWMWQIAAAVALLVTTIWGVQQFRIIAPAPLAQYNYVAQDSLLQVALPDGSQVYLNEGSELTYYKGFGEDTRSVQLAGEGYFEVVPNATLPFLVQADSTTVRVVGTSFNVKQAGQAVRVTVNSGKVAFSHQKDTLLLTPDEVGVYQSGLALRELVNDDPNYLSWKTGTLRFDDIPFSQVIRDIARHYQVTIHTESPELQELRLTSAFRQQPLAVVLEEVAMVLDINYTYEDNQITFFIN